jgi:hypothetical protein
MIQIFSPLVSHITSSILLTVAFRAVERADWPQEKLLVSHAPTPHPLLPERFCFADGEKFYRTTSRTTLLP